MSFQITNEHAIFIKELIDGNENGAILLSQIGLEFPKRFPEKKKPWGTQRGKK